MSQNIIEIKDLSKTYPVGDQDFFALNNANLSIKEGEIVAILGPSGSGKSTLMACIAGLDDPDGGLVTIDGKRMTRRAEDERAALRGRCIGFMRSRATCFVT